MMSPRNFLRRKDLDVHDRFEQGRLDFFHRGAERLAAGGAERVFVGIDGVIAAVDQRAL